MSNHNGFQCGNYRYSGTDSELYPEVETYVFEDKVTVYVMTDDEYAADGTCWTGPTSSAIAEWNLSLVNARKLAAALTAKLARIDEETARGY